GTLDRVEVEAETAEKAAGRAFKFLKERKHGASEKKLLLVTREESRSRNLAGLLQTKGVDVLFFPTFQIVSETDGQPWKEAATRLREFGWIFFTSQVAVEHFFGGFLASLKLQATLAGTKFAVIGEATRRALEKQGFSVDLMPSRATSEALAETFLKLGVPKEVPLLFPTAEKTRGVLEKLLAEAGYQLTRLVLYSMRPVPPERFAQLDGKKIDYVLFTSSESVGCFLKARPLTADTRVISIGPVTSATVRQFGLSVYRELPEAKLESVAEVF
ncbi:MAG: uroporphyrinogen-III synthase, partial [Candidatus Zixiibacteriota bacterium]